MSLKLLENIFPSHRFSVAPMMNWTDRHCRYFFRQLSKHTLLYTEMVNALAILHSKKNFLTYNEKEHPIALQLGGSCPVLLAQCARLAKQYGYDEINLNIGCPSHPLQNGTFGVSLMRHAKLVADCVKAMRDVVSIPVTIKTRIGVDEQDSYEFLCDFINTVSIEGGCETFIIHARKACLSSFNPKENREIPPLDYSRVYQAKRSFPDLTISLNGGIQSLDEAKIHLKHMDGVMLGRQIYRYPYMLSRVDDEIFGSAHTNMDLVTVVRSMYPYIEDELNRGTHLNHITRHMLGLFRGRPGGHQWRRYLVKNSHKSRAGIEVLEHALHLVTERY